MVKLISAETETEALTVNPIENGDPNKGHHDVYFKHFESSQDLDGETF